VRRGRLRGIVLAALLLVAADAAASDRRAPAAPARAAAPTGPPVAAPADRAALERVLAESGAKTRRRPPGLAAYLGSLVQRAVGWIGNALESAAAAVAVGPALVRIVAWSLATLAAAAVLAAVAAAVRRRRRRPAARRERPAVGASPGGPDPRGAADWRAEIERRLAAGRIAEALAAVWEWLAGALCGAGAEPSWTGGELLAHGRRPDLAPAVARLDAMTYGPRRPRPAEVRELVRGLEQSLDRGAEAAP